MPVLYVMHSDLIDGAPLSSNYVRIVRKLVANHKNSLIVPLGKVLGNPFRIR